MGIASLPMGLQAVAFFIGLGLLMKGADWLVDGAAAVAEQLGISKLVIGLTIVAIGTSAPEFAVSSYAAYSGSGDIALANVVGSNIFNLGFILALCAIITPLSVDKVTVYRDCSLVVFGACLLTYVSLSDLTVERWEGAILLLVLLTYIFSLFWISKRSAAVAKKANAQVASENKESPSASSASKKDYAKLIIGLSCLLIGCNFVVDSAKTFATAMGLSEWFIGITVIAIGTSLPELVTALTSVLKKDADIGVGGLLGSDIFNIFGVIGVSAVTNPIHATPDSATPFYFLIMATAITALFLRLNWRLNRIEGWALFFIAAARYAYEIF